MSNIFDPTGRSSALASSMTGYGPSAGGLESFRTDFPQGPSPASMPNPQMAPGPVSGPNQGNGMEPPETPQEQILKEVLKMMRGKRKIQGLSQGIGQPNVGI